MKTIGIVVHSAEGGALCFLTACREGQRLLGPHMHPAIVLSAVPLALSMPGWESDDYHAVAACLRQGVEHVAAAGADFFICPDNTAHIVLDRIAGSLPIPGLHVCDVVCHEIRSAGFRAPALLGTRWTVTGSAWTAALQRHQLRHLIPPPEAREEIHRAIFEELCLGSFRADTTDGLVRIIADLAQQGADCVILGCTELPLVLTTANSPLPIFDSTRLLASSAVRLAIDPSPLRVSGGWVATSTIHSESARA